MLSETRKPRNLQLVVSHEFPILLTLSSPIIGPSHCGLGIWKLYKIDFVFETLYVNLLAANHAAAFNNSLLTRLLSSSTSLPSS
jgi:hypothetical protein